MENGNMQSYLAEEENKYAPRVPLVRSQRNDIERS